MPYLENSSHGGTKSIKLTIDSNLENVSLLGAAINKLSSLLLFSDVESYEIEVSVVEAVNNAIIHAYSNQKGNNVEVIFTVYPERVDIDICDTGMTMEKKNIPFLNFDPDHRENLPEKGMGFFVINRFMDKVSYTRSKGKNILRLTKFLKTVRNKHQSLKS